MDRTPVRISTQIGETTHSPENWLQIFDEENVQLIILDSHLDIELINIIRLQPEWNLDFEDDELVIFTSTKGTEK